MFGGRLGWPELIIILVIVLVVFGVGKLANVGGTLGKAIREFRKASKAEDEEKPEAKTSTAKAETESKQVKN